MLVWLLVGAAFIFIGLTVHVFKWYFLIAGYNTMPKEKKANVDIESVARLMGYWGYFNGAVCILIGLITRFGFGVEAGLFPALIVFGVSTVYLMIRAQKYDLNFSNSKGGTSRTARRQQFGSIGVTVISLIVVGLMMVYFIQPTKVTIDDQGVTIHGLYGGTYSWESIAAADLVEELPPISRRTNGAAIGPHLRGYFRTSEGERIKLFVNRQLPPFIHLVSDDGVVYFNLKTADDTRQAAAAIAERL
ncbi:MAG TPA: DUF3784 domain-containing protein [Firmicutes bacterium]|nr:DUF3784 domain-containing protein [Bacillota bacterium]